MSIAPQPASPVGAAPARGSLSQPQPQPQPQPSIPPASGSTSPPRPSISPSRANDFVRCPLLFRYRVIDKLPEPPSGAARRGTLVHSVLDRLFDAPPGERTTELAHRLLPNAWQEMRQAEPELATLFKPGGEAHHLGEAGWLHTAAQLLGTYFELEDPNRLEPRHREQMITHQLADGPLLRGVMDRVDVASGGAVRIVDYKTGKAPAPRFEHEPLFQMRCYALLWWRDRGEVPAMLQLVYLGDGQVLRAVPATEHLEDTEQRVRAIWQQIAQQADSGRFSARRSPLCAWCRFQSVCPQFGGEPPPLDQARAAQALGL